MQEIPLELIDSYPLRLSDEDGCEALSLSLASQGQLSPILVRPHPSITGRFLIVFGNRRYASARSLGWRKIRAEVANVSEAESLVMAFSENVERDDFSDYEKALLLERIHKATEQSYSELALLLGRSIAFVYQHLAMLKLFPEEVASESERRKVACALTERHARVLSRIDDANERWNTAKLVAGGDLCVRELQRLVAHIRKKRTRNDSRTKILRKINEIIEGENHRDFRPYFTAISKERYSLFNDFPPSGKLESDSAVFALDHIPDVWNKADRLKIGIEDLDIKVVGKCSLVTMIVSYTIFARGQSVKTRSRGTVVFEKDDDWKIIHEHWSLCNPSEISQFSLAPINQEEQFG